jgi:predicted peptidase
MRPTNALTGALLITALAAAPASATDIADGFAAHRYDGPGDSGLNYRLHVPETLEPGETYPLVLFLHGAGERGDDNQSQLLHGAWALLDFTVEQDHPALILAPQVPADQRWVDVPWNAPSHEMPTEPSAPMGLAIALLDEVMTDYPVDPDRVYVTGLSMGGFGTWDILQRLPQTFAAAIPICGGGDVTLAARIRHVPVWAFHGGEDTLIPPHRSTDMVIAIKAAGGQPSYTEYGGVGHDAWSRTYANEDVLWWLFDQARETPAEADQ